MNESVKNIIFDLGGVIVDINPRLSYFFLSEVSGLDIKEVAHRFETSMINERYETGQLTSAQFRTELKKLYNLSVSDREIDAIWNNLLIDIPHQRVKLLQNLSTKYRLFLLSNTNPIHIKKVNEILQSNSHLLRLELLFEKTYYSYEIEMRKPDAKIYQYVLDDLELVASETVFVDDLLANIESAASVGIQTIHVTGGKKITDLIETV